MLFEVSSPLWQLISKLTLKMAIKIIPLTQSPFVTSAILKNSIKNPLLSSERSSPVWQTLIFSIMIRSISMLETVLNVSWIKSLAQEAILTLWVSTQSDKTLQDILQEMTKYQLQMLMRSSWLKELLKEFMSFSTLWSQVRRIPSWYPFLSILCTLLQFHSMEDPQLPTTWTKRLDGNLIWKKWRDLSLNQRSKVITSRLWLLSTLVIQLDRF